MKSLRILPLFALLACGGSDSPTEPPPPPVATSIVLSAAELTFDALWQTAQMTAVVNDQSGQAMAGERVVWSTGDAAVAFISPSGLVTARQNGQTTITATAGTITAQATVAVAQVARQWTEALRRQEASLQILGPEPAFIGRVKRQYRYHTIVKAPRSLPMLAVQHVLRRATEAFGSPPRGYRIAVDVDPMGLF